MLETAVGSRHDLPSRWVSTRVVLGWVDEVPHGRMTQIKVKNGVLFRMGDGGLGRPNDFP